MENEGPETAEAPKVTEPESTKIAEGAASETLSSETTNPVDVTSMEKTLLADDALGNVDESTFDPNLNEEAAALLGEIPDALEAKNAAEAPEMSENPGLKELLHSTDRPSRLMTALSFIFAGLASICLFLFISVYLQHRRELKTTAEETTEQREEETETSPAQAVIEELGEFQLLLKGEKAVNEGQLTVNVSIECASKEVCTSVKEHLHQARDTVNPVLSSSSRDELMQSDSKKAVRKKITERLNEMPFLKGKIIQVYFSDMTIEEAK